ncbi:hypothetical protein PGT21_005406 [Puccinia graminis f. sp. tritici]|uniref:DUF7872 domain-containing protein n=2 Tax=Puccinia graminis f. sp. tritici TaxID=56615 RepID=E3JXY7_PUCGT|nr:uncharacterized protein PGTG_02373 [Puccinia graminis f. sp. tritici CRL 75-36-700-3]EFP76912.1 hypothetical protein PGTG_02373 [Puccinia graminis f. sp. tritici CRL 75-36-700-3]KAA1118776.1 hypothetical protein PGT21_005406 [Puccinia graminis f. sp. tritici]KAA1135379.1 hypothetical protein PGTUg99_018760 [Puccinia graminis f. sp. tritici]
MGQVMRNRRVRMPLLIALANSAISSAQVPPPTTPSTPSTPGAMNIPSPTNSTNSTDTPEPLPVTTVSLMNNGQIPLPTPDSLNWTDPCAILPLQPATWNRLNLDQYLANYPGGQNYTLTDYALSVSVQNWVCGIGEACDAQQPCNPIPGPQWEVLYAVQNWNLVQNTLYNAIGMAVSMTQSITSAMVTDLYHPAKRSPLWKWNDIFSIAGGIAALIASVVMVFPGTLLAIGIWYSINAIIATGEGAVGIMLLDKEKKDEPDPFQRWSEFAWYLGKWQSLAQGTLSNRTTDIINAGISTPKGISGVLKNGTYFRRIEARQFQQVESEIKFTATAKIMNAIIRDYGGFVTVGDGCKGKGPNGAWSDPDSISFCYPNKTMMNVIRHKHDHAINTWYHGSLINSSYGFTAEYLTTQSYNCQIKYGKPEYNPYNNTAVPTDRNADCIINLPVCDTRIPAIRKAIKKHGTVKACREVGKLPI